MKKSIRKVSSIILSVSMLTLGLVGCQTKNSETVGKNEEKTLTISMFGFNEDLYRKNVIEPFEKKHNVKVVFELGSNADRISKLKMGASKADVAVFSAYHSMQGIEEGAFEKINPKNIPNIENLYDIAKAPLGEDYGPAYAVASFGIMYDKDKVQNPITSWGDLWRPDLKDKILLPDITTTGGPYLLMIAAEQAGVDIKKDEDKVFEKLKELSKNTLKFSDKSSDSINMIARGEVEALGAFSFESQATKDAAPNSKWVDPKEGSYAIINTINIVKGTKNKKLAEEYINWLLSEDIQKVQAIDKIDSPVNKNVKLTEEQAEGLVYGKETIEKLNVADWKYINDSLEKWIERWNKEVISIKK
ncbi:spermidine/putrescine-binding periplasmic protein [Gottschalkia purinilytica]|uniref:Spermidine/putrescine-binding periplasmic protein n=1 Tax=Gottschalkia purinilytica TaxID=1503 RepID=A0A0L0W976_GOTPU|nr:ABC transporter substrate-binding protein [Gottschalkia purinilytica]KNF07870.1 spermidine/putrescine-binding periplasmic protein [Gottschalkia purinilytica]